MTALEGGKPRCARLTQRFTSDPGTDAQEIECTRRYHMLELGFGHPDIPALPHITHALRLRHQAFHACPHRILRLERVRFLVLSPLLEHLVLLLRAQREATSLMHMG